MQTRIKHTEPNINEVQVKFFLFWRTIATFKGEGAFSNYMALNSALELESRIRTNQ